MRLFNFFKPKQAEPVVSHDMPTYQQRVDKLTGRIYRLKMKLKELRHTGSNNTDRYKNLERELIYNEELFRKLEK